MRVKLYWTVFYKLVSWVALAWMLFELILIASNPSGVLIWEPNPSILWAEIVVISIIVVGGAITTWRELSNG